MGSATLAGAAAGRGRAGIPYTGPAAAFQIYGYAFRKMKRSRETLLMVVGFAGILVFPAIVALVLLQLLPGLP